MNFAIREFSLEGVLDEPKNQQKWFGRCEALNKISTYQLAKYIIEGYEYPKTKDDSITEFIDWLKEYNIHILHPTKNSSYRRGRRDTLDEIERKLIDLNLIERKKEVMTCDMWNIKR